MITLRAGLRPLCLAALILVGGACNDDGVTPSPSPTSLGTPTPIPGDPTPTASAPTPTARVTPTPTERPSRTPTAAPTQSPTPTAPGVTPTEGGSPTLTPVPTPTPLPGCDDPRDRDCDGIPLPQDCDDTDPGVNPDADEICDGKDNDCDGDVDAADMDAIGLESFHQDQDQDGYGSDFLVFEECEAPAGFVTVGGDCQDSDAAIHPGAAEVCNGKDDDCDGQRDNVGAQLWYADADGDGFGQPGGGAIHAGCDIEGSVTLPGDCDDGDPAAYPGASEVCDGDDEDCDGRTDEGLVDCDPEEGRQDVDGDGFTVEGGDCDDRDPRINPDATERCDRRDNDCDGGVDEGLPGCVYTPELDLDGDGWDIVTGDCAEGNADIHPGADEACNLLDDDCDGQADEGLSDTCVFEGGVDYDGDGHTSDDGDCGGRDPQTFPGAPELCDDTDNDCDGVADEGLPVDCTPETDLDGDGFPLETGDCDDLNPAIHPGAEERCNRFDDDCDGVADEGLGDACEVSGSTDVDGDGWDLDDGDCDGADPATFPGADEACDLKDNDCDGLVDEGVQTGCDTLPGVDLDGDGYTIGQGDCDDGDAGAYPGGEEICDFADNDCDSAADEGLGACTFGPGGDFDDDGVTLGDGDCNDGDPATYPGAPELCDRADNDCDALADEGLDPDCEATGAPALDNDGDGWGPLEGDCNDFSPDTYPGAPELCDVRDNDCDGVIDEGMEADCGTGQDAGTDDDGDGLSEEEGDCDDTDGASFPEAAELCDFKDNDCDGVADEGLECGYSSADDFDGDGWSLDSGDCNDAAPAIFPGAVEACNAIDDDCDGISDEGLGDGCVLEGDSDGDDDGVSPPEDCDDTSDLTGPGETEICDLKDNDCDGTADEGIFETCDYGDPEGPVDFDGDGVSLDEGDCDDADPATYPNADELCDSKDNDCDVVADEGLGDACGDGGVLNPGGDADGDGFSILDGDCNDLDGDTYPGAEEICDRRDNDCDDHTDEGLGLDCGFDPDADNDGDGFTLDEGDCDDLDPTTNPGQAELCDLKDNDCDGIADEDLDGPCPYSPDGDYDADGFDLDLGDCNDLDPDTYPGADEICDLKDNDCDGAADEGVEADCHFGFEPDGDGDGYTITEGDCDDANPDLHPGAEEVCNFADEDCDHAIDEGVNCGYGHDADWDGDGHSSDDGDCNDFDASVYPGASEVCDGKDNNCSGVADEGLPTCDTTDADQDDDGYTVGDGDCDDTDFGTHPGAIEFCDFEDNDCDGVADEDFGALCYGTNPGDDRDEDGYTDEGGDCNDFDADIHPGAVELCDRRDNDCDGEIDEGASGGTCDYEADLDDDGFTVQGGDCNDLNPDTYPGGTEICDFGDNDCDLSIDEGIAEGCDQDGDGWTIDQGDCADWDSTIYPGADEICDIKDNDCDGSLDEGYSDDVCNYELDHDGDGWSGQAGDCADFNPEVYPGAPEQCDLRDNDCDGEIDEGQSPGCALSADQDGDGYTIRGLDCNDLDPQVHPGATEVCDHKNNDCDTSVDEAPAAPCAYDDDFDGDGWTIAEGDCDDYASNIHPGAVEYCDGQDTDCDGVLNELFDGDGDGFTQCTNDCDDTDPTRSPGADEVCNDLDDDCDGLIDNDAIDAPTWYYDGDRDGYGGRGTFLRECDQPPGYVTNGADCNDSNGAVNPAAAEICNGIDDNCDGLTDVNAAGAPVWYRDADRDGYGNVYVTTYACNAPYGYVGNAGDCNDGNAAIHPGATERCDGIDYNCDGRANSGPECVGCADGQREGFTDQNRYPYIAGCAAAWRRPGVLTADTYSPTCGRGGGDDGPRPGGEGCTVTDACASGWHVCRTPSEVSSRTGGSCGGVGAGFYLTRQSSNGCTICASGSTVASYCDGVSCVAGCAQNQNTANDVFGCGNIGATPNASTCGVLTRFSNDLCSSLPSPWDCNDQGGYREAHAVYKTNSGNGGVMCCRD